MATAAFNDVIIQVHSNASTMEESLRYYVRWFDRNTSLKELTFEYLNGTFLIIEGEATARETGMLIHCIQALELSHAFHR